jgi:hypothetical protein
LLSIRKSKSNSREYCRKFYKFQKDVCNSLFLSHVDERLITVSESEDFPAFAVEKSARLVIRLFNKKGAR